MDVKKRPFVIEDRQRVLSPRCTGVGRKQRSSNKGFGRILVLVSWTPKASQLASTMEPSWTQTNGSSCTGSCTYPLPKGLLTASTEKWLLRSGGLQNVLFGLSRKCLGALNATSRNARKFALWGSRMKALSARVQARWTLQTHTWSTFCRVPADTRSWMRNDRNSFVSSQEAQVEETPKCQDSVMAHRQWSRAG